MNSTCQPTPTTQEISAQAPVASPTQPDVAPRPLESVLAEIRHDCRIEPGRYLDEVRVPFGGE